MRISLLPPESPLRGHARNPKSPVSKNIQFSCSTSFTRQISCPKASIEAPLITTVGSAEEVGRGRGRFQFNKKMPTSRGISALVFTRRWIVVLYLVIGVNAAIYMRPSARPLLNMVEKKGLASNLEQVRVSLEGKNYMRITWTTPRSTTASSTVQYGRTQGNYQSSVTGSKENYSFLTYKSGDIHSVVIGPLESNTVYYYKCGGNDKEFSFKTPPSDLPLTFAVVGDLGQTGWTATTLNHVQNSSYDVLVFAGDISYADYVQPRWDSFGRLVEPLASARPWMLTEGNHELETLPILGSFKAYNARWKMPYEASGSSSNLYYSFEAAGSHVIMLGSYADFGINSPQYNWLQADLGKIDRRKTPWLIVVLHAPWYNSNNAHQGEGDKMMNIIEPLLMAANTDLLFAGHVHAYERWDRMYNGKEDACGIVHITIGDGGNREGLAKDFLEPQPQGSVFREASFGHGQLKLVNGTHAHWSWHRNDDDEDKTGDEVWIKSLISTDKCKGAKGIR